MFQGRTLTIHVGALGLVLVVIIVSSFFGATPVTPTRLFYDDISRDTWLYLRAPRALFAFFAGAGLAVCGAVYQAIFKNPLASPFSLGISAAASLGAAVAMVTGASSLFPEVSQIGASILGAGCAIIFILRVGSSRRGHESGVILLAGVAVSLFSGSLITLIQYLSDYSQLFRVTRWMIGGSMTVSYPELLLVALLSVVMLLQFSRSWRDFDLLLFGNEFANAKGVDTQKLQQRAFLTTSLFVGVVVALCGVIGFVGIIVPATIRLLNGIGHKHLVPLSFYLGGLLVVVCDCFGRTLAPPYEIPVGVFTALIGAPVFLWLLMRSRSGGIL